MCVCKIKILTESGGQSALFEAEGSFESFLGGERVRYTVDGDEGELVIFDGSLEMHRYGKCPLQASFSEGRPAQMVLGNDTLHGSIPLRTNRYLLEKGQSNRNIELEYELFQGQNIQTFSLKIQVFFSEEK